MPSVVKAHFGKKYFIWKGKALHQFVATMAKEIDRSLRLGTKENDIFEKVVHHIKYARIVLMEVEAVCQSEDPAEILVCEHRLLAEAKSDPLCLNTAFAPHVPKWIPDVAVQGYKQQVSPASRRRTQTGKAAVKGAAAKKGSASKNQGKIQPLNRSGAGAKKSGSSAVGKKTKVTKTK
jgi:hypothetical protein